jgi:uncharacterized protein (TIGR00255 family)
MAMVRSMTGFGQAEASSETVRVAVEVRSVNSRYAEVTLRSPRSLNNHEAELTRIVKQRIARGRINVAIQVEETAAAFQLPALNTAFIQAYATHLRTIADAAGTSPDLPLELFLKQPDIYLREESDKPAIQSEGVELFTLSQEALERALEAFCAAREEEGRALDVDFRQQLHTIHQLMEHVATVAPRRIERARERLKARLAELTLPTGVDEQRLEQEIVILTDKLDLNEEIVRLTAHLRSFESTLASDEPIGRKLNFLCQEMNREINTIGSKANDAEIAGAVVGMKEALEKLKEQVENVE